MLAAQTAPSECSAVVKANGYGLGAHKVTAALYSAGCRRFFVATIDEAISLRNSVGGNFEIYVFEGFMSGCAEEEFDTHRLIPVLNTPDEIRRWSAHTSGNTSRRAIVAIDTGMNRLGLTPRESLLIADDPSLFGGIKVDYIMSHLACADNPSHPMNSQQRILFDELRAKLPPTKASLANSGGIFLGKEYHYDLTRPGAAIYGITEGCGAPRIMKQVVGVKAKILQVRVVDTESTVGYGATKSVPANSRLATVAAGYADGYLRSLSNCGYGYIDNVKVPVVGRISMDLTVFDISAIPGEKIAPGDHIDLICSQLTVDDVANAANTNSYEILTSLGIRYGRHYIGEAA